MQIEGVRRDSIELLEPALGKTPETLNAVDMTAATSKLVCPMMNSEVPGVADIDQPIIAAPSVRMNDRFERDSTANNGLQRNLFAVRYNLSVDLAITLEESKDDGLARCAASTLTTHPASTEVAFINFDVACRERRVTLAIFSHTAADFEKDCVDCFVRQAGQLGNIRRWQIECTVANKQAELPLCDSRTPVIAV